jgi:hypothetical protein
MIYTQFIYSSRDVYIKKCYNCTGFDDAYQNCPSELFFDCLKGYFSTFYAILCLFTIKPEIAETFFRMPDASSKPAKL